MDERITSTLECFWFVKKTKKTHYQLIDGVHVIHRDDDAPSIVHNNGSEAWYKNDKLHRDGKPASISKEYEAWYKNGRLHRVDGPALTWASVKTEWYLNGQYHREYGPAVEFGKNKKWYKNGLLHRIDGPAVEVAGDGSGDRWFINGVSIDLGPTILSTNDGFEHYVLRNGKHVLHRLDGPAKTDKTHEMWYTNGVLHKEVCKSSGTVYNYEDDVYKSAICKLFGFKQNNVQITE